MSHTERTEVLAVEVPPGSAVITPPAEMYWEMQVINQGVTELRVSFARSCG